MKKIMTSVISERKDVRLMKDFRTLCLSSLMMVVGVLLFMFPVFMHIDSKEIIMVLVIVGGGTFFFGMSMIMSRPMKLVFLPTGSRIGYHKIFFSQKHLDYILNIIDDGSFFEHGLSDKIRDEGNVQVGILMSEDSRFASILIGLYENDSYKPLRNVVYFFDEHAFAINEFLKKHKQSIK